MAKVIAVDHLLSLLLRMFAQEYTNGGRVVSAAESTYRVFVTMRNHCIQRCFVVINTG